MKTVSFNWKTNYKPPFKLEVTRIGEQNFVSTSSVNEKKIFLTLPVGRYTWRVGATSSGIMSWSEYQSFEVGFNRKIPLKTEMKLVDPDPDKVFGTIKEETAVTIKYFVVPKDDFKTYEIEVSTDSDFESKPVFSEKTKNEQTVANLPPGRYFVRARAALGKTNSDWAKSSFSVQSLSSWSARSHVKLGGGFTGTQEKISMPAYLGPINSTTLANAQIEYLQRLWTYNSVLISGFYTSSTLDAAPLSTNSEQTSLSMTTNSFSAALRTHVYQSPSFQRFEIFVDVGFARPKYSVLVNDSTAPSAILEGPLLATKLLSANAPMAELGFGYSFGANDRVVLTLGYRSLLAKDELLSGNMIAGNLEYRRRLTSGLFVYAEPFFVKSQYKYSGILEGNVDSSLFGCWIGLGIAY